MKIESTALVEEKSLLYEKETFPWTFFSLDASEKLAYNNMRQRHNRLNERLLERADRRLPNGERETEETEIGKEFMEIINPHLKAIGNLEARRCFVLYGDTREARVETPTYRIFDPEEPFDLAYTVDFYFPTANDALSCKSSLSYAGGEFAQDQRNMVILNHAFARCNEGIKQDGTSYPLIYTRGNGLYFASTKFAMPIMGALRNILLAMGREAIEELRLLYGEYLSQLDREGKPAELRRKVFKEAYDSKLELTLKKAGLIESKLEAVE